MSSTTITSSRAREASEEIVERAAVSRTSVITCRALDIVVSLLALILLAPLLIVIAAAIRLDSRGPVIFRQKRRGLQMSTFVVNKFRTMHPGRDADEHMAFVQALIAGEIERDDSMFKLTRDDRVTRVGRVLRKTSLDELPQLVNVLLGQMSLVGPRPCLDYELEKYPVAALRRFAVKPGITGLWQVSGRSQLTFDEMIALDLRYAETWSLRLNLAILVRTLPVVLLGRGAA